jgi:hypothetical protein
MVVVMVVVVVMGVIMDEVVDMSLLSLLWRATAAVDCTHSFIYFPMMMSDDVTSM